MLARGLRRATRSVRAMSTTTTLVDITQAPRTASWSIHELQRHDADVLTSASLLNLAELCHLHIPDDKLPTLLKEVEDIIQCTKTIQEITLDDSIDDFYARSEALSTQSAPLRPDEALEGNCPDDVLANASVKHGYYFQVPKVLED